MRRMAVVLSVAIALGATGTAGAATKRILVVGDSWAMQICVPNRDGFPSNDVFDDALAANGLGEWETQGAVTAWGGRKASDWAQPARLAEIVSELQTYPTIDIVHLIIGGNDFLSATQGNAAFPTLTQEQRDAVWTGIEEDIQTIVDTCLAVRDDIRVVIADYDYLDHERAETFYGWTWYETTVTQFNTWLTELGQRKLEIAQTTPRCEYVQNWGTLQYWFGTPAAAVPYPGVTPDYDPYPGGAIDAPWPAGVDVGDGIHPTDAAHAQFVQNAIDQYYSAWLPEPEVEMPVSSLLCGAALLLALAVAGVRHVHRRGPARL